MHSIHHLFRDSLRAYLSDRSIAYAAGLAYYAVFAVGPLVVFVVAVAGPVVGHSLAFDTMMGQVRYLLGPEVADLLAELAGQVNESTFGRGATVLSVLGLILGAAGVFSQLDKALNDIWGIATSRPTGIGDRLILMRHRVAPFTVLFFVGLMFTSSVLVDTMIGAVSSRVARFLPEAVEASIHINRVIIPALAFFTFYVVLKWLPDARSRRRDVAVGALLTALLFLIGRMVMTEYLERAGTATLFGSVGYFVVLMIWIYYSAQVLLFGAEFTKVYADRFGQPIVPRKMSYFRDETHGSAVSLHDTASQHKPAES